MNELIEKLMDQCKEDYMENFAKLIAKKCIQLCDQVDLVGADDCINNIKEYFDIE